MIFLPKDRPNSPSWKWSINLQASHSFQHRRNTTSSRILFGFVFHGFWTLPYERVPVEKVPLSSSTHADLGGCHGVGGRPFLGLGPRFFWFLVHVRCQFQWIVALYYTQYMAFNQKDVGSGFLKVWPRVVWLCLGTNGARVRKFSVEYLDSICALWIFGLLVHSLCCFRVSEITNERDSQCTRTSSFLTVAFPLSWLVLNLLWNL